MSTSKPANVGSLKFLTYNIDGLNPAAISYRTETALSLILLESPDVVQLQEVVADTAATIIKTMVKNGYTSFHEADRASSLCHYFTLSFARADKIKNATIRRIPYSGAARSEQGRDSLQLTLTYMNKQWMFINCHLESCGVAFKSAGSAIRMAQLTGGLESIARHSNVGPAILAGDLNIRDPEAVKIMSDYTHTLLDAAAVVEKGRKSNTWYMPGPSKYSARYDRVYSNLCAGLKPVQFKVIGGEDIIEGTGLDELYELTYATPSDHRGVVVTYAFEVPEGEGGAVSSTGSTNAAGGATTHTTNGANTSNNNSVAATKRPRIPSDAEVISLDDSDSEDSNSADTATNKRVKLAQNNSASAGVSSSESSNDRTGSGNAGVGGNDSPVLTNMQRRELFLKALERRSNA